mgnify:CR=1 FL=1|jgi:DNA polymerase III subunit gamma/tau
MSYQVLARKWRPRSFAEVLGQGHVLKALVNALDGDRLHHAYLFTGTRGVGKTTLARVFAKALNCEQGVSSTPCGQCSSCVEINEGRFVDLIEVDAASRTKVEETRELLDNVQYAPTRARYKVYLIDEVHMFSNHSFNALLKTLEEPPPHVKFLLATTDPKKLPVTILSRCLQFNLTRLGASQLSAHLAKVLDAEGVEFEPPALDLIAPAAAGSVRDALSLLDQAIAHGAGRVLAEEVALMLGTVDQQRVIKLLDAIALADGHLLIARARELSEYVPDYAQVLAELLSLLRRVAVVHALDGDPGDIESDAAVQELAGRIAPDECQLYYQIALNGRRDLPYSPDPESGFEMNLLRMLAFRPASPPAAAQNVPAVPSVANAEPIASSESGASGNERSRNKPSATGKPAPAAPGAPSSGGPEAQPVETTLSEPETRPAPRTETALPAAPTEPIAELTATTAPVAPAEPIMQPAATTTPIAPIEPIAAPTATRAPMTVPELAPHAAQPATSELAPPAMVDEPAVQAPLAASRSASPRTDLEWSTVVDELDIVGLPRELARNCALAARDGVAFELVVAPQFDKLAHRRHIESLQSALGKYFGCDARVNVRVAAETGLMTPSEQRSAAELARQQEAEAAIDADPKIQALRDTFGATIEDVSAR